MSSRSSRLKGQPATSWSSNNSHAQWSNWKQDESWQVRHRETSSGKGIQKPLTQAQSVSGEYEYDYSPLDTIGNHIKARVPFTNQEESDSRKYRPLCNIFKVSYKV